MNVVKDEVKYEMQENANMAKGAGVPVSQNMVPAASVGSHGTHQPHTGQASGSCKILYLRLLTYKSNASLFNTQLEIVV